MTPIPLTITTAGLARFTAAQAGADIDLTVSTVGVTAVPFVVSPTLTTLPGEMKRLGTVAGETLDDSTVHMTIRDLSADAYDLRGIGLYLADGTLFGVYGQADPILGKSALSTTLLALDIMFPTGSAGLIQFGDTNFLYPPATTEKLGVAEIATQAEVNAGTDDRRFVTPLTLAQRLAAFASGVASAVSTGRKILASGLATGGGDLTADRTIDVPVASAAETEAGTLTTKAVTPASLVNILATIAGKAAAARQVLTGGLATGGGSLAADRTITVAKASGSDVLAGTDDSKATTPKAIRDACMTWGDGLNGGRRHVDGSIEQWGGGIAGADGSFAVVFPIAFPNQVFGAMASNNSGGPPAAFCGCSAPALTGMTVWQASANLVAAPGAAATWRAWGR